MTVCPSGSYQIDLPDDTIEQVDGRVVSFWLDGQSLLLQLSSVQRVSDDTLNATERLRERIAKTSSHWEVLNETKLARNPSDQAFAYQIDHNCLWLHGYLVWPHLVIYVTISGTESVRSRDSWPFEALSTLRLNVQ